MGNRLNPEHDLEKLEHSLESARQDILYPPTPDIAARTRAAIEDDTRRQRFAWGAALAGAAAMMFVVLAGVWLWREQTPTKPPAMSKAYIANLSSGDLTVIDWRSGSVINTIPVGRNPWGLAASDDGRRVYVAIDGGVAIVNAARMQVEDNVSLPSYERAKIAVTHDERYLLVAVSRGRMAMVELSTQSVVSELTLGLSPYDIKVSSDNRFAYVLGQDDGSLAVVNLSEGRMIERLALGAIQGTFFMALTPDSRTLYVPKLGAREIWQVDTQTRQARGHLTEAKAYWSEGAERGMAVSPDGRRLYIATQSEAASGVSVLDTQNFAEIGRAELSGNIFGLALTPDGSRLVVTDPIANKATILSADTLKTIGVTPTGNWPYRVVIAQ